MNRSHFLPLLAAASLLATPSHAANDTFVYCSEGSPSTFNPMLATDGTTFNASSRHVYNRLVEFKYGETTIIPALAEKWDISKDGKTYTFKLRKGVKWHTTEAFKPSRAMNADDVVFTFMRQFDKNHPFHKVSGGTYEYFDSMDLGKKIKSIEKKDEHTVVFTLNQPEAPFLANLAMDFASITSAEYAEKMKAAGTPEKADTDPVGTGPFMMTRYTKDSQIRYKANPDYWKGKPKIENMVFMITKDPSVRFQKLKTGECHFATEPAPADLDSIRKDAKLKLVDQAGLNVAYLAMNSKKAPFDNAAVRTAFTYAINRQAIIDAVFLGNAKTAKNPMPPTIWGYNSAVKDYEFNPEKAKAELTKAGFDFGKTYALWYMPVSRPYNPNGKKMAELMAADLSKIGVKTKLVTFDWPTYLSKSKDSSEFDFIQFGWTGDNGDPDNFLNVLLGCAAVEAGGNRGRWCDPAFEKLVSEARMTPNQAKRTELYKKAQLIVREKAPWLPVAHSTVFRAMAKNVNGYKVDPFGGDVFTEVTIK